jgi:hypothetical protein
MKGGKPRFVGRTHLNKQETTKTITMDTAQINFFFLILVKVPQMGNLMTGLPPPNLFNPPRCVIPVIITNKVRVKGLLNT